MTFDVTGLVIFLLAIIPGVLAQQSRHLIVPRPLEKKSTAEETGEYVINSIFIHVLFFTLFGVVLTLTKPVGLSGFKGAFQQKQLGEWLWNRPRLVLLYFLATLVGGYLFGFARAVLALNQPVRKLLGGNALFSNSLERLRVYSFLQSEPVWYDVLHQTAPNEITFIEVRMKDGRYYTGELQSFGIVDDSERAKDFYLVNVYFTSTMQEPYRKLNVDGVLLNFEDADAIAVLKQIRG